MLNIDIDVDAADVVAAVGADIGVAVGGDGWRCWCTMAVVPGCVFMFEFLTIRGLCPWCN